MSANPDMVAGLAMACVPLVPYQPPRCSNCGACEARCEECNPVPDEPG